MYKSLIIRTSAVTVADRRGKTARRNGRGKTARRNGCGKAAGRNGCGNSCGTSYGNSPPAECLGEGCPFPMKGWNTVGYQPGYFVY